MNKYINEYPEVIQEEIRGDLTVALKAADITDEEELKEAVQNRMDSEIHDLIEVIDISEYI
ncbi:hypothetical protein [Brochothrix thermosphacta]|uniref:hypothetical protein n=1 Tax=Brochothrix thermosphacta TaxID=2756 RepID=UPI00083F6C46|nr:hypothetical protein [Brochothrix thermosphacta]ODJ71166.1 hypothetical protein BFR43_04730 [Brochothrix thermosphacta]